VNMAVGKKSNMSNLKGRGLGVTTARSWEDEPSSMIQEQLARLKFAEYHISIKGKRVLDFGCGTGYNCYYLANRNAPRAVVGIDLLKDCIEHCKRNYLMPNVKYLVQDCLEYNENLGLFDVIISCEVIEHVDDQVHFMRNLERYLAPGGYAFISTPNKALFSLSKDTSFLNHTHKRELLFHEFRELLESTFSDVNMYSQVHSPYWHSAYINYLSVANLVYVIRKECFQNRYLQKVASIMSRIFYVPIFMSRKHPDVRKRKHSDFNFIHGFDSKAIWLVAICKKDAESTPSQHS
jgi:2-polyprenyl-3-methyl-5-hydroxy-6-metoxy-1,4-benzoquinol methylase